MKKLLLLLFIGCLAFATNSFAATKTATASTAWTLGSTWNAGSAPAATDSVIIGSGVTVQVENSGGVTCQGLNVQGGLNFGSSTTRQVNVIAGVNHSGSITLNGSVNFTANSGTQWISWNGPAFTVGASAVWTTPVVNTSSEHNMRYTGTGLTGLYGISGNSRILGALRVPNAGTVHIYGDMELRTAGTSTGVGAIWLSNAGANVVLQTASNVILSQNGSGGQDFLITSGAKVTLNGTATLENRNTLNGVLAGAGAITLNGTSKYIHNKSVTALQGTVAGTVVNNTGTTYEVRGAIPAGTVTGVGQTFYNFIWNSALQGGQVNCNGVSMVVNGTMDIQNTGNTVGRSLRFTANALGQTVTINGDLKVSGLNGIAVLDLASGDGNPAVTVNGTAAGTTGSVIIGGNSFSSTLTTSSATAASTLSLKGNWTIGANGVFTPGTLGTVSFTAATADQTIASATTFRNLTINKATSGSVVVAADVTVMGALNTSAGAGALVVNPTRTLTATGTTTFGANLVTFKSDATGSGSFGNIGAGTVSGTNVAVERFMATPASNNRAWHVLTIPVESATATIRDAWANSRPAIANAAAALSEPPGLGTLITGHQEPSNANGFDYIGLSSAASSIRKYSLSPAGWPATALNTPAMSTTYNTADEAYMLFIRGDRTKVLGIPPNVTTFSPKGSLKTGTKNYTVPAGTFKLIGNPYASRISFASIQANLNNILDIEPAAWTWNSSLGSNGGYITYTFAGIWLAAPDPGGAPTTIESGQGFFFKGSLVGGTIEITEADKVGPATAPPYVFDASAIGRFSANLNYDNGAAGTQLVDGVLGIFTNGNTLDATDANDISKALNFNENISLLRNGKTLAIEAHPVVTSDDILYLSTTGLKVRDYMLQFKGVQMQSGITAILQDAFLGKDFDLSTADNVLTDYRFSVTADAASAATDRFRVVFKGGTLPLTLTSAKAYSLNNGVQVDWKTVNERGVRSYEVEKSTDGRNFGKATTVAATGASSYGWYDVAPVKGNNYYRIKGIGTNGEATYSQVLMVNLSSGKSAFSVYPNPVKGGIVGVQFSNMEKGKYSMVVYNSAGQKVVSRDITHLGGSATEEINLGTMASGVYRVSLISNGGSTQNQTLVIQK